jgi:hypothetical protein
MDHEQLTSTASQAKRKLPLFPLHFLFAGLFSADGKTISWQSALSEDIIYNKIRIYQEKSK